MLFRGNMARNDHLVILSYMVPFYIISGHYDSLESLLNSRFFVSELFFRNKYKLILISIVYASKSWVTWPFWHNKLKNDHFDHFIDRLNDRLFEKPSVFEILYLEEKLIFHPSRHQILCVERRFSLRTRTSEQFEQNFGYIDVGDGCWRPNVLATRFGCCRQVTL